MVFFICYAVKKLKKDGGKLRKYNAVSLYLNHLSSNTLHKDIFPSVSELFITHT